MGNANTLALQNTVRAGRAAILHDASAVDMDTIKKVQAHSRGYNLNEMPVFGEAPVRSYYDQGVTKTWAGDRDLWGDMDQAVRLQQPHARVHAKKKPCGCGDTHSDGSGVHLKVAIIILLIALLAHHMWLTMRKGV